MPGRAERIPFEFAKTGNFGCLFDIIIMKIIENLIFRLKSPPMATFFERRVSRFLCAVLLTLGLMPGGGARGSLIINEFYQNSQSRREWVEFLVTADITLGMLDSYWFGNTDTAPIRSRRWPVSTRRRSSIPFPSSPRPPTSSRREPSSSSAARMWTRISTTAPAPRIRAMPMPGTSRWWEETDSPRPIPSTSTATSARSGFPRPSRKSDRRLQLRFGRGLSRQQRRDVRRDHFRLHHHPIPDERQIPDAAHRGRRRIRRDLGNNRSLSNTGTGTNLSFGGSESNTETPVPSTAAPTPLPSANSARCRNRPRSCPFPFLPWEPFSFGGAASGCSPPPRPATPDSTIPCIAPDDSLCRGAFQAAVAGSCCLR